MNRLNEGLKKLGLESSGPRVEKLERYISEIELWNPKYGMIAPGEDLVSRHILDSLSGLSVIQKLEPGTLADVGSGAGFPGIPLAIWMEDTEITLIERSGRRAGFLRNVVLTLDLKNVRVLEKPAENAAAGGVRFDVVTFRAWSAIDDELLNALGGILTSGGTIAAYKGRLDVIRGELAGVSNRLIFQDIVEIKPPFQSEERHLVLVRTKDQPDSPNR